jgi:predicted HD phosphohydrolase
MRVHNYWSKLDINPAVCDVKTSVLLTPEERQRIRAHARTHPPPPSPVRTVCGLLHELQWHVDGLPVNQLIHSLQTATRALRENASDEVVLVALLHDVGKVFSGPHHAEIGAAMVRGVVSQDLYLLSKFHPTFQSGLRPGAPASALAELERFRPEVWFDLAATFATEWDQAAFDPGYDTLPLDEFLPLIEAKLARR